MKSAATLGRLWLAARLALAGLAFLAGVALLMLYLTGAFHPRIPPAAPGAAGRPGPTARGAPLDPRRLVEVRRHTAPRVESAVGTIRPVQEAEVSAKILARVQAVEVSAGQPVRAGQVLLKLDDADLTARLKHAQAVLEAAAAGGHQARLEFERVQKLLDQGATTRLEFERYHTALKTAEAQVQQAQQALHEARTVLSYATITAPMEGIVVDKRVDVGYTVAPGQVLLTMYGPTMQLLASVRESLSQKLRVGQPIDVVVEALGERCTGRISEIVPESEAASRSFQVKVTGPCHPGVKPGMFGRVLIPLAAQQLVVVPRSAVRRVGQLDLVEVAQDGALVRRAVQLGPPLDDGNLVPVLAGLRPGEMVAVEVDRE